jgi:DNA-binding NtrC family response regulator
MFKQSFCEFSRRDLYYRLDVVSIEVPPLREHHEDIPELVDHFLPEFRPEDASQIEVTRQAMDCLVRYQWPGNIRQLCNAIERACALCDHVIEPRHLSIPKDDPAGVASTLSTFPSYVPMTDREIRRRHAFATWEYANHNRKKSAAILDVHPTTFDRLLKDRPAAKIRCALRSSGSADPLGPAGSPQEASPFST